MKEVSEETALRRIVSEFSRRGWNEHHEVATDLVRMVVNAGGVTDVTKLAASVPRLFLTANEIGRAELMEALERALAGVRVASDKSAISHMVHVQGDGLQVFVGGSNVVNNKKIVINNQGQFAGNIDSPKAQTRVEKQQQVLSIDHERVLREHINDPEVQEILALPALPEEKKRLLGGKLARLTGIGLDVATDFGAKLIAEFLKPR